ncbi:MAG: 16S rRNA (uracil(1498)-N(3))-methyltransferase [Ignavibacteria bacterium]|nr:16S rRNA (uracil(1498)-N(3))-methyltransferase [Ignavibacteria bacterium]
MHFFYCESLNRSSFIIRISGEEFKHFRALRVGKSELVAIVDGNGLAGIGFVKEISGKEALIEINHYVENLGESDWVVDLALGILDSKERLEYAFEKSVELRISNFLPLITKYTLRNSFDKSRLFKKGISAIKQTGRSRIPEILDPLSFDALYDLLKDYDLVLVSDFTGKRFEPFNSEIKKILLVVGPEGGFTEKELAKFKKKKNVEIVKLGNYKLRSETAAVCLLYLINHYLQM